jgi:mannose-6-phosphate isomerase-like protein (cupin superfamily)
MESNAFKFSERAARAMEVAQGIARSCGSSELMPEHLLLALIRDDLSAAALMMSELDIDLLRILVLPSFTVAASHEPASGPVRLSQRFQRSLQRAVERASTDGAELIGTEHLLIGLVELGFAEGTLAFTELGLDPATAVGLLERYRGADRSAPGFLGMTVASADPVPSVTELSRHQPVETIASWSDLKDHLRRLTDEIGIHDVQGSCGVRFGLARFAVRKQSRVGDLVSHPDQMLIARIMEGAALLRMRERSEVLSAGALVHLPPGTAHDFIAINEPLLIQYVLIPR